MHQLGVDRGQDFLVPLNINSTDELVLSTRQPGAAKGTRSRPVEESAGKPSFHPSHFELTGEGQHRGGGPRWFDANRTDNVESRDLQQQFAITSKQRIET